MSLPPDSRTTERRSSAADDAALDWLIKQERGLTRDESVGLEAWLAVDSGHRDALTRCQRQWQALDTAPQDAVDVLRGNLAADLAADMAKEHAASTKARRVPSAVPRRRSSFNRLAFAAVGAAVVIVGGAGYVAWDDAQRQPSFARHFETPRGQQMDVALSDGSRLRLDTATQVEVALFRHRREVRLGAGQAVFQVSGDAQKPFDVLAGPLRITVMGTRFSVRHTPGVAGDDGVRVAVEEGRVRVGRAGDPVPGNAVELAAGQQVGSDAVGALGAVAALTPGGIAPWRDNRVSFDDAPLARVLAEFERYGPTRLLLRDPAVAALRITGTFDPRRLDHFVNGLPQVLPVQLRAHGGETEIVARP